jgi:hypothetical protein
LLGIGEAVVDVAADFKGETGDSTLSGNIHLAGLSRIKPDFHPAAGLAPERGKTEKHKAWPLLDRIGCAIRFCS